MTVPDASETTEADGPEGSDKPPCGALSTPTPHTNHVSSTQMDGLSQTGSNLGQKTTVNGLPDTLSIPLPPPEEGSYPKEPGHTRPTLCNLVMSNKTATNGNKTPSTPSSPTFSESECESRPSTRPPSQAPSRAASMSAGVSGGKVVALSPTPAMNDQTPLSPPFSHVGEHAVVAHPMKGKTASEHSVDGGGHKFNLKDLLASGPKIVRRSSQRSTGSGKKSDSDSGAKSVAGESTASLSKKYGVCQKLAIGKGATSVVRLAHKWDRSEEKLYAVKVSWFYLSNNLCHEAQSSVGVPKET